MTDKVLLPKTDLRVSRLCLGSNMFGTALDQGRVDAVLDRFVALGGNFIDTARSYGDWIPGAPAGASERAIGAWLKSQRRQDVVVATKGGFFDLRVGDYRSRANPADVAKDLAESLEHLQVDAIDLYWLHADDPSVPVGELIDALIAEQSAGKIRAFGASNWSPERLVEAQAYAAGKGHAGFAAFQPFWGLATPNAEAAAAQGYGRYYDAAFADVDLPVIPYAGQSRGVFSKLADGGEAGLPEGLAAMYLNDANRARLPRVQAKAKALGASVNAVVLAWLINQSRLTIPIIGASRPDQLDDAFSALSLNLSAEAVAELAA
ncbi:aldo/keto reductase [Caulobacter sp. Root343]|uniref:aldo/keto reductase n=1 Tax=Caulobacter sp. Root343 TaxID=1736520 RepID=UPI0006F7D9CE|nr:aldo/keto reductase [Caulobacter sp. Root343]KQV64125.1 aldo/keto reductase [Caulobacter sp. Root343]